MNFSRIAAGLLTVALFAAPTAGFAQANGYGVGQYRGTISSVKGGAVTLNDGRTVFLQNGTVINPTGIELQPGMRISIMGSPAGNGNVNAGQIDVAGNRYDADHASTQFRGRIAFVKGGAVTLEGGRTIFLGDGTVINPTGIQLQPGMRISIMGSPAGNGNINAGQIDIMNDDSGR
jgi:hypothetical protein